MENEEAKELLSKYSLGECTEAEKSLVEDWLLQLNEDQLDISEERINVLKQEVYHKLPGVNAQLKLLPRIISVAAAILLAACIWLYTNSKNTKSALEPNIVAEIKAGGSHATLILANGKIINLDQTADGSVANQGGIAIIKNTSGQIMYKVLGRSDANAGDENTLSTPKGGEYQVILPDGTKVWLNAESTLKFPSSFSSVNERKVELVGEAYFEVAKDKKHPFIVRTREQELKVLGTHFNISSYHGELSTKTTLLEGSVCINNRIILKPGEQARLRNRDILVVRVDTSEAIAWKNGEFMFRMEPLSSIMGKLARWYNVEIAYENATIGKKEFGGTISKFENVSEVLNMLELTGEVHFKIEGRRITAMD